MEIKGIFPAKTAKRSRGRSNIDLARDRSYDETTADEESISVGPMDAMSGPTTIVCIVENRAREVCICKLKTSNRYLLEITIVSDGHAYNETMLLLRDMAPQEILLHDGCRKKVLTKKIESSIGLAAKVIFISRQYFDQDRGADMLARVQAGTVDSDMIAKYTVLSASHCVLKYVENCTGNQFPAHSLRITFDTGFDVAEKMSIDRRTAINLELVADNITGDQLKTLFGMINYCKTTVGTRLLRSNILRPLTNIQSIQGRQSLVEAFLKHNAVFADVAATLVQFPDLDKMLNGLSYVPKSMTLNTVRTGIDTLLFIKHTIFVAHTLSDILRKLENNIVAQCQGAHTEEDPLAIVPVVQQLINNLHNESVQSVEDTISELLAEQSKYSKVSQEMRFQECFAIKSGVNGMLDVARKTYLQAVEEMYELAEQYSHRDGIPIKVHYTASRGYFLCISSDLPSLPADFVQAVLNKKTIYCTTVDMMSLSDRTIESIDQALSISHDIIQNTFELVRTKIDLLFNLADAVALLDMIASFADVVALSTDSFVKPNLVDDGPLVVRGGRHPIVSNLQLQRLSSGPFVANDVLLTELESFCVVTGPNGSGKTIFQKQLALIVILAQIGCFVPATYALIPIRDKILTRIGNNDDIEHNMSTFSVEMKEAAYIVDNCTHRSLVLIDELGRGSSIIDGLSLAMAIAEELIIMRAYVLFVTHFPQIPSLQDIYPTVKNVHLKARLQYSASEREGQSALTFSHEVAAGPCALQSGYGIVLSEMCGFPAEVVEAARAVRLELADKFSLNVHADTTLIQRHLSADSTNRAALQQALVVLQSAMSPEEMKQHLASIAARLPK